MDRIKIAGGQPLRGTIPISGAKNAALPLLFSTLLTSERCVIRNVPMLADVRTAIAVLQHLGAKVSRSPDGRDIMVEAREIERTEAPYDLVKTMRASFLVLAPLLARFGRARQLVRAERDQRRETRAIRRKTQRIRHAAHRRRHA